MSNYFIKSFKIKKLWGYQDIDLTFNSNVNVLIGPNGSGKTTILNLLYSILTADIPKLLDVNFEQAEIKLKKFKSRSVLTIIVRVDAASNLLEFAVGKNEITLNITDISGISPSEFYPQGSYGRRTVIRPFADDVARIVSSDEFRDFAEEIEVKFKDLLILDVAHQLSKTGQKTFFQTPDRFFKVHFQDNEIRKQYAAATSGIQTQSIDEAKNLVEKYLREHRFIDILPGHFAFGIMRRLISNTVGKSIPNDEIRLYISRVVWQLVNTRDHNSLKRRLRRAVREAEQIRQVGSSQAQSSAGS